MNEFEDISFLITDMQFRMILDGWKNFDEERKNEICSQYNITSVEVEQLHNLYLGLDFKPLEVSPFKMETSLTNVIHEISDRIKSKRKRVKIRIYDYYTKIAAILLIPLSIYIGYLKYTHWGNKAITPITVCAQMGTISTLHLPDGSQVWLNAGSVISYPSVFAADQRKVSLTGEAYFKVTKNKNCPMIVSVNHADLKVYGTQFNVSAFNQDNTVKVTLVEGSVSLTLPKTGLSTRKEMFIKPGETLVYDKANDEINIEHSDTYVYTAWKKGVLIFRNTSFEKVVQRLSRRFNVDIELNDKSLASIPMDATFRNETIDEILNLLSLSTPFSYHCEPSKKMKDGSFKKKKIYIERTNKTNVPMK